MSGATGKTGAEVARRLIAAGKRVRTLTRNAEKATALTAVGVEVMIGDGADPALLARALQGVQKLAVIYPNGPDQATLERLLVEAAVAAKVDHIVKLSSMEARPEMTNPVHRVHFESENRIRATGLNWTMIRPNFFMQNLFGNAPTVRTQGKFFLPFGSGAAAMTDTRDVAEVIALVLGGNGGANHAHQVYEITGPEVLTFAEVAQRFSAVLGRRVEYVDQDPEAYRKHLAQFLKSAWHLDAVCAIFKEIREGYVTPTTDTFQKLMGRAPTAFQTFVSDHRALFGG